MTLIRCTEIPSEMYNLVKMNERANVEMLNGLQANSDNKR